MTTTTPKNTTTCFQLSSNNPPPHQTLPSNLPDRSMHPHFHLDSSKHVVMSGIGRRVVVVMGDDSSEESSGSAGSLCRKSASSVRRTSSTSSMRGSSSYRKPHRWLLYSRFFARLPAISFLLISFSFLFSGCLLYIRVGNSIGQGETGLNFAVPSSIIRSIITTKTTITATTTTTLSTTTDTCDPFNGRWVPDRSYPYYNGSLCPFVERGFNCQANGRNDTDYMKWRWKPRDCDLPRFHAQRILELLRGKKVVFVGDSMSRTQWESMICMLRTGVEDPNTVYEVNKSEISKTIRYLGVRFESFNLTIEFFRSVFLAQQGPTPPHAPKRVQTTLQLDKLDDISERWIDSDVLIFNSGHWWTSTKLFDAGTYFEIDGSLKLGMHIQTAFKMMMETWASWIKEKIDTNRTHVFFRTFEPSHWGDAGICKVTEQPMSETNGNDQSEFSDIIADVVSKMNVQVTVLNVTSMGAYRSDAHIGSWTHPPTWVDCSHWCLPGVPDAWNEIIFSYLLNDDAVRSII